MNLSNVTFQLNNLCTNWLQCKCCSKRQHDRKSTYNSFVAKTALRCASNGVTCCDTFDGYSIAFASTIGSTRRSLQQCCTACLLQAFSWATLLDKLIWVLCHLNSCSGQLCCAAHSLLCCLTRQCCLLENVHNSSIKSIRFACHTHCKVHSHFLSAPVWVACLCHFSVSTQFLLLHSFDEPL